MPDGTIFYFARLFIQHPFLPSVMRPETGFLNPNNGIITSYGILTRSAQNTYSFPDGPSDFICCLPLGSNSPGVIPDTLDLYKFSSANPALSKVRRITGMYLDRLQSYNYINQDTAALIFHNTIQLLRRSDYSSIGTWAIDPNEPCGQLSSILQISRYKYLFFSEERLSQNKLVEYDKSTRVWRTIISGPASVDNVAHNYQRIRFHHFDTDSVVAMGFENMFVRGNKRTNTWHIQDVRTMGMSNVKTVVSRGDTIALVCGSYIGSGYTGGQDVLLFSTDHGRSFVPVAAAPNSFSCHINFSRGMTLVANSGSSIFFRTLPITSLSKNLAPAMLMGYPSPASSEYAIQLGAPEQALLSSESQWPVVVTQPDGRQQQHLASVQQGSLVLHTSTLSPGLYNVHFMLGGRQYRSRFTKI